MGGTEKVLLVVLVMVSVWTGVRQELMSVPCNANLSVAVNNLWLLLIKVNKATYVDLAKS